MCTLCFFLYLTGHQEIEAWYITHLKSIRAQEVYRDCFFSISIENNSSQIEPGRMADNIRRAIGADNIQFVSSLKNGSVGVWTGAPEKEDMAKTVLELLAHNQLRFAEVAVAVSSNWSHHVSKLIDQMNKFRMIEKAGKDPAFNDRQVTWSGKAHGQSDDIMLSLQINLSNHKKMRMSEDFVRMCREQGKRF